MCPLVDSINTNSKKGGVNDRIPLQVANNNDVKLPGVERDQIGPHNKGPHYKEKY